MVEIRAQFSDFCHITIESSRAGAGAVKHGLPRLLSAALDWPLRACKHEEVLPEEQRARESWLRTMFLTGDMGRGDRRRCKQRTDARTAETLRQKDRAGTALWKVAAWAALSAVACGRRRGIPDPRAGAERLGAISQAHDRGERVDARSLFFMAGEGA